MILTVVADERKNEGLKICERSVTDLWRTKSRE